MTNILLQTKYLNFGTYLEKCVEILLIDYKEIKISTVVIYTAPKSQQIMLVIRIFEITVYNLF